MRFLLILSLLILPISAIAEFYKWTDANGRVQFSDKQPEHNNKVEKIGFAPAQSVEASRRKSDQENSGDNSILERQKKMNSVLQAEREQREADSKEIAEQKAQKRRHCAELGDYKKRSESSLLYNLDAKGERKFMDEKEQAHYRIRLEQELKAACQ